MDWILKFFNMTCKDVSPIVSEEMDHDLPPLKRLKLKIHLAICEFCRYYKTQLETLRRLARRLGREETVGHKDTVLSLEAREKLQQIIKRSD